MLPNDPNDPNASDDPPTATTAELPGEPTETDEQTGQAAAAAMADGPGLGYVAGPAPVPVAGRTNRRGFVLGVALTLVTVLGGSALFVSGYSLGHQQAEQPGTASADQVAFKSFWDTYHSIRDRYALGPVDTTTLVEGAIRGMVASIGDPYSSYLSPEDFASTLQDISGQFEGIGTEIGTVDANGKTVDCATFGPTCRLVVVTPIAGSPAEKAGIKAGDVITSVDGASLDGLTPDQARDKIRGKAGTSVKLHIERKGAAAFDLTLVRAKIQREEVIAKELSNGTVGYVELAGFSDAGADAFVAAVKADVDKGIKKIVVDLRGNPGGFINDAQKVASAFIASGPVFWQQYANGTQEETDALPNGVATDSSIKVVVLIDHGSASAAEIVAGALQDTKRATLVGETSFGKGTVQQWLQLEGAGGVKLTIAKWLTPLKRWIHKIGLVPDVAVAPPANASAPDAALDRAVAILTGAADVPEALLDAA
jgi:carboxyl-terminal processing protease